MPPFALTSTKPTIACFGTSFPTMEALENEVKNLQKLGLCTEYTVYEYPPIKGHLCHHCGLNTAPLAYHEGAHDCQVAMRAFTTQVRETLEKFQAFGTAWELGNPWQHVGADSLYHALLAKVIS